jgi:HAE1 family hydrophobic/amphiphilic exporter-1
MVRQVRVKDVGRVELGAQTYKSLRSRLNRSSRRGCSGCTWLPGANADHDGGERDAKIAGGGEGAVLPPEDDDYDITLDSTLPMEASIEEIVHTLLEAVVLVLIVVYVFLQNHGRRSFRCARCRCRSWGRSSCFRCWDSASTC